ncbi:hypothetical protein J8V57_13545 [Xenorhabdus sp. PB61.4]|uniref:Cap15 family cyclic dinucleotide receptor domain-containing protein n=1 Tax=Xenorhabdus sp. PB61.4 TaxID=2788940 RepID=UPI001E5BB3B9|nr:hypothetical protein [Xenorhabdus sp. PB61.4]MCC8367280.1 hypothetical protein [Xenorhabdus sp. PB61.4]
MKHHEYIVINGFSRSNMGRILSIAASALSAFTIYFLLKLVDLSQLWWGIDATLPPSVLSLAGAGMIYFLLYHVLNKYLWKRPFVGQLISMPNLSGEWEVIGKTLHPEERICEWKGVIRIVQTWDKVRIRQTTNTSQSDSITASVINDQGISYRLLYNYTNRPLAGNDEMQSHVGFVDLEFSEDLNSAIGEYFNGRGRNTYGTMTLRRKNKNGGL